MNARNSSLSAVLFGLGLLLVAEQSSLLGLWSAVASLHGSLQSFCVGALEAIRSHLPLPLTEIALAAGAAVFIPGVTSVVRQVRRTNSVTRSLLRNEVTPLPESLARLAAELDLTGHIRLIESHEFHAFCFGLMRPQVCIGTAVVRALPSNELEALLHHESWHLRRRDPLRELLANALAAGLWFLPLAKERARFYRVKRELDADTAAIDFMKDSNALAGALYWAATWSRAGWRMSVPVGAFNAVDARIDRLLGQGLPAFRPRPLSAAVSVLVLVGLVLILCVSVMAVNFSSAAACVPC